MTKLLVYRFLTIAILLIPASICAGENIVPVVSATAQQHEFVEQIPLSGSVYPWKESTLSPQIDGLVVELLVDDGDRVQAGDLLVRLDNTIADLNAQQARAAMDESKASYRESLRQRDEAAKLVQDRHVAKTAYKALIAEAEIKKAAYEKLIAEYRRAGEITHRYQIVAPFDGVIGETLIEIGQWVESGEAVVKLFDIDKLKIRTPVPQRYFPGIKTGMPVVVRFDALPGLSIDANINRITPVGNPTARTFPVRVDLTNSDHVVMPGMSARILFQINRSESESALSVPRDAIVTAPDGSESVWKIIADGAEPRVKRIPVDTGRVIREFVEITNGTIASGDRVVIRGNEVLHPDQKVRVLNQTTEAKSGLREKQ